MQMNVTVATMLLQNMLEHWKTRAPFASSFELAALRFCIESLQAEAAVSSPTAAETALTETSISATKPALGQTGEGFEKEGGCNPVVGYMTQALFES